MVNIYIKLSFHHHYAKLAHFFVMPKKESINSYQLILINECESQFV